ncbi:MAG: plastocyanin/azurin family copper-binding protein, partial [Haloarcula sp.]
SCQRPRRSHGPPRPWYFTGDGPLDSELVADEGSAYEHTFEETGTHLYSCEPHKSLGMRGAIIVE